MTVNCSEELGVNDVNQSDVNLHCSLSLDCTDLNLTAARGDMRRHLTSMRPLQIVTVLRQCG